MRTRVFVLLSGKSQMPKTMPAMTLSICFAVEMVLDVLCVFIYFVFITLLDHSVLYLPKQMAAVYVVPW